MTVLDHPPIAVVDDREARIAWWRGHRLKHMVNNKSTDFAWMWVCRRCGDVSACWRSPRRHCPGRIVAGLDATYPTDAAS